MSDDDADAEKALSQVQAELGISLWLVKTRLHYLERTSGLDAQKKYVVKIRELMEGNGLAAYVAHFASVRNESNVTFPRFRADIESGLEALNFPHTIANHLRHHLLPFVHASDSEALAGLLLIDGELSAVDHYEALIAVASHAVVGFDDGRARRALGRAVARLGGEVADPRLISLAWDLNQGELLGPPPRCDWGLFEASLHGTSPDDLAAASLNAEPHVFEHIPYAAAGITPNHTGEWISTHLNLVRDVQNWGNSTSAAMNELSKIASNTSTLNWGASVQSFLLRVTEPLTPQTEHSYAMVSARVPYAHPVRLDGLSDSQLRATTSEALKGGLGVVPSFVESFAQGRLPQSLPVEAWQSVAIMAGAATGRWEWLIENVDPNEIPAGSDRARAVRALTRAYLETSRVSDAVRLVANWAVRAPQLLSALPVAEIGAAIDRFHLRNMQAELAMPVFLDVYTRRVNGSHAGSRSDAAEDFLNAHDVARPSQIASIADQFDRSMLVYYLRRVCVESVMDSSIAYSGSRELAEERQAVCSLLATLDSTNADVYTAEAHEIGRRLTIQRRMREIETSRIYVDVEGVRHAAELKVQEAYNRYVAYLRNGLDEETVAVLAGIAAKSAAGDVDALIATLLPDNEVSALLTRIFSDVRDEFVSSTEHGLDGYLSVQVRHGALSKELRIPLEAEHLVTQTDGSTGEYKANEFWEDRLQMDPDTAAALSDLLGTFSRGIDALISEMKDEWVQVKRRGTDPGLFDFAITKFEVGLIASRTSKDTPFNEFLDLILDVLQHRLQATLEIVRREVTVRGKHRANELLTDLLKQVDDLLHGWSEGELTTAVNRARTQLSAAFDRVGEWFQLTVASRQAAFALNEVIGISEAHIRRSVPGFRAEVSYDPLDRADISPKEMVIFNNLVSFGHVLFMALDNVVKHSELPHAPVADVRITVVESGERGDRLRFRIENDVGLGVASSFNRERIEGLRAELRAERLGEAVTSEGGTGLLKIWKTLRHDFDMPDSGAKPEMDFGYIDEDKFFLSFEFPVQFSSLSDHAILS